MLAQIVAKRVPDVGLGFPPFFLLTVYAGKAQPESLCARTHTLLRDGNPEAVHVRLYAHNHVSASLATPTSGSMAPVGAVAVDSHKIHAPKIYLGADVARVQTAGGHEVWSTSSKTYVQNAVKVVEWSRIY